MQSDPVPSAMLIPISEEAIDAVQKVVEQSHFTNLGPTAGILTQTIVDGLREQGFTVIRWRRVVKGDAV